MPVEIKGGNTAQRELVRRAYDHVIAVLPSTTVIPVEIVLFPFGWPRGTEARSTRQGVQIRAAVTGEPRGRAEYLLYEELAHHIASDRGLPHEGNAGIFLHELFAGYVKFRLVRQHHSQLTTRLTLPEIGTTGWQRFYGFGTDLGALLAGISQVEPVIQRFITNPAVATPITSRGAEVIAGLRGREWRAPALLERCLALHPELKRCWDEL
jgi:hypothetical protein